MTNAIFLPQRYSSNLTMHLKLKNLKDILSLFVYLFARLAVFFFIFFLLYTIYFIVLIY